MIAEGELGIADWKRFPRRYRNTSRRRSRQSGETDVFAGIHLEVQN
jgi:hypothetical protein